MRHDDFDQFGDGGDEPQSHFLKHKRPAVFVFEEIIHEGIRHEVRMGCGWCDKPLPPFRISFVVAGKDYVMVSNPDITTPPDANHPLCRLHLTQVATKPVCINTFPDIQPTTEEVNTMRENDDNTVDKQQAKGSGKGKPDLTASLVTHEGGKKIWSDYFAVWRIQDGYYRGKDNEGNIIIVQTREAHDAITGEQNAASKKLRPDLFIYIETEEGGEKFWDEILVAWKTKNSNFLTKNAEGQDIVIRTREAKEAFFNQFRKKRVAPVDLDSDDTADLPVNKQAEPQETTALPQN